MDRPGISRAVTMGVLGFIVGALLVIVVRALQTLDPIWDVGVGLVFGTFFSAGFFVWGIGAFDPRLSAHGEEEHHGEAHIVPAEPAEAEPASPAGIFSGTMWQITFAVLLFIVALAAMAVLGPTLITTADPTANVRAVGMVPFTIGSTQLEVSQLVIFVAFVLFMLVSLAVAAFLLSVAVSYLSRGIAETNAGTAGLSPAAERQLKRVGTREAIVFFITFFIVFIVLYLLFYYVLIGLVLPNPPELLTFLSLVNALVITILILRPMWVVTLVAKLAGWLAYILRGGHREDGTRKIDRRNRP